MVAAGAEGGAATMTDARPRRPRRPSGLPVHLLALGLFLAVLALLALQMRAGRDPLVTAAEPEPRQVVVRRVERRVIITVERAARAPGASAPAAYVPGEPASTPSVSAPPAAAPAPAPAPTPAPAPVVTRSS